MQMDKELNRKPMREKRTRTPKSRRAFRTQQPTKFGKWDIVCAKTQQGGWWRDVSNNVNFEKGAYGIIIKKEETSSIASCLGLGKPKWKLHVRWMNGKTTTTKIDKDVAESHRIEW